MRCNSKKHNFHYEELCPTRFHCAHTRSSKLFFVPLIHPENFSLTESYLSSTHTLSLPPPLVRSDMFRGAVH